MYQFHNVYCIERSPSNSELIVSINIKLCFSFTWCKYCELIICHFDIVNLTCCEINGVAEFSTSFSLKGEFSLKFKNIPLLLSMKKKKKIWFFFLFSEMWGIFLKFKKNSFSLTKKEEENIFFLFLLWRGLA